MVQEYCFCLLENVLSSLSTPASVPLSLKDEGVTLKETSASNNVWAVVKFGNMGQDGRRGICGEMRGQGRGGRGKISTKLRGHDDVPEELVRESARNGEVWV